MRFAADQSEQTRRLRAELRRAQAVTPALAADVLALAEASRLASGGRARAARIRELIRAEAWTDGALALIELGLPQWKLRRIVYEDGEWHCSLGKHWPLPAWLDDVVDVSHPMLPLALLTAFVQACSVPPGSTETARTVPSVRPATAHAMCCDNFA